MTQDRSPAHSVGADEQRERQEGRRGQPCA